MRGEWVTQGDHPDYDRNRTRMECGRQGRGTLREGEPHEYRGRDLSKSREDFTVEERLCRGWVGTRENYKEKWLVWTVYINKETDNRQRSVGWERHSTGPHP